MYVCLQRMHSMPKLIKICIKKKNSGADHGSGRGRGEVSASGFREGCLLNSSKRLRLTDLVVMLAVQCNCMTEDKPNSNLIIYVS